MKELNSHEIMQVSGGAPQFKNAAYCSLVFGIAGAVYGFYTDGAKGLMEGAEYAILGGLVGTIAEAMRGLYQLHNGTHGPTFISEIVNRGAQQ